MEWILPGDGHAALSAVIATADHALARPARDAAEAAPRGAEAFLEKAEVPATRYPVARRRCPQGQPSRVPDLAKTSFAGFQQPIAETLKKVDQRLSEAEHDRVAAYARLTEQVAALVARPRTRCRRRCARRRCAAAGAKCSFPGGLELAGMVQRCDFDEQPALSPGDNGRLRPDLIVHLPGGKRIVVDAKAPLEAFLDAQEPPTTTARG